MRFSGHPLNGSEFLLIGKRKWKDGLYYGVQLPDQSIGYLPAKWFSSESGEDVTSNESLIASVDAIRKMLLLVDHLENRTPPNVE